MNPVSKLLVLDGIAGIPLGREIAEACRETGVAVSHFDCLQAQRRPLLAATLLTVYGVWQREGAVRHLVARQLVDHTALLQGLDARSRNFR